MYKRPNEISVRGVRLKDSNLFSPLNKSKREQFE